MIEGSRQAPWVHEAQRRNPHSTDFDCTRCKEMNGVEERQAMSCGYEVPIVGARPPWTPVMLDASHRGEYTICPGYTTKLPEVVEIARLVRHAKMGSLTVFVGRDAVTEQALLGMEMFDHACGEVQAWAIRPADEGGGGR